VTGGVIHAPPAESRIVVLEGAARERGVAHGRALRVEIHDRLERLLAGLDRGRSPRADWERRLDGLQSYAVEFAPEQMREVEGIAEGAGIEPRDAFMLNAFEALPNESPPGCTALAVARSGGALIAQNWDGTPDDARDLAIVLHVEPAGARTVVLASAGGLGWAGLSSRGCALLSTDLLCRGPVAGLPSQFLRRLMLGAADIDEALELLARHPFPSGRTYVLGDRAGTAAIVEVAPGVEPHVRRVAAAAVHANHAEGPRISDAEDEEALQRIYPSSWSRHRRAAQLIEDKGPPDVDRLREVLKDHGGRPLAICKHTSHDEPSTTVASLVFDLARSEASMALGAPCSSPYAVVGVGDLA
jgi:isopenicillin-N N-acyltransferase-like protein